MPNPKQVMENPQQKKKVKFYHVQEEEAEQLYQGSLQETYRHNMEQSRFYKKKAREKNQIPPDNGSFSGFKKVFKALGRFLTGTPNYYELYNKIDSRWEAYNLSEVSHNLEEGSNHILEENSNRDPMTQKVTLQKVGVYQAFTNMAEHGEFFDAVAGDKVLMNLQGDAFSFEEKDEQLSDNEKQALRDATAAREDLARFLEQLKQFKEAHGKLSPENLSKLRSTYLEKKEGSKFSPCGKYIFELVTGVEANKESLDYASKNHPDLLQMIIYTQILNQMDLAIHQMLIPKQLGNDSVLLNLEQYAHLQAQKKETNRLLTELMNKTDIRTEFKNKFESNAQKDALKDKSKKAGAEKTSEKNKDGNEQEGKEANLSTDKKFMTLYTEYSKLAGDNKDAKKQFLIKNLKTLLAAAAEISKNQSNEEKADENGVVAPLSVIKDTVSKIANDPFAYDYFAINMTDFDQLMNATACMIPDSEVSKTMDKAALSGEITDFYKNNYSSTKKGSLIFFTEGLEEPEKLQAKEDTTHAYHNIMLEFYDGFHSKKLEKYNPLFSVVKKISSDPKAYEALLNDPFAKEEFKWIHNLISMDYGLHILEDQQLQKDQYYKNLEKAAQELDRSLPVLKTWYKKYPEDLAQKEKEAVTASLKEQIKDFSNLGAPQDEKTDAGKQDSAKDKVKENASDKTKKFLDTLKEFIAKNPVNDKDENAEIYNRIYETLANPQIEVVMKQPKALQDVLNLSSFILKGNRAVTDLAYNSYSTLTQALQAEQERLKAEQKELHDEIQGAVSKEKALERISEQVELLEKKAKNPNSVLNTQKLIDSLTAYIENHLVIEKYSVVEKYVEGEKEKKRTIKKQVSKDELLKVLKDSPKFINHPETLNQLLDFADSVKKDQSQTAPKAFAQSWAITKETLVKEQKEQKEHETSEKISKKINKIKVKKLNNLKETKEKIKIIKEIKEIKKQEEQERRNAAQNLLNDIFDKKVGLEPPINAELEPEQRLNEEKKTITFWTKMTGFATTISAWLSKPFKKKSVANNVEIKPQEINENDMKEITENDLKEINDLDDIGLLDEYEEEEGLKIEPVNNENLELNRNSKIQEDNKEELLQKEKDKKTGQEFKATFKNYKFSSDIEADAEELQNVIKEYDEQEKESKNIKINLINKNTIKGKNDSPSISQDNITQNPQQLNLIGFPRTFEKMENVSYEVPDEMKQQFLVLQKTLISQYHTNLARRENARNVPEYYMNFSDLYNAWLHNPTNILLVKLINLLKCNNPRILRKELSVLYNNYYEGKKASEIEIDPLLLLHLTRRSKLLDELNMLDTNNKAFLDTHPNEEPCPTESKHFVPEKLESQIKGPINICWSIGLSNLLACQGIKIPSKFIRAARVEDAKFELSNGFQESDIYTQSTYGEFGNVHRGFQQISYLNVVKNYDCVESTFQEALIDAQENNKIVDWYDWFISKLKEAFGGDNFDKNHSSAMTFANDKHVVTILGFDNLESNDPAQIQLYVHDSLYTTNKGTSEIRSMTLTDFKKEYIPQKNDAQENMQAMAMTSICYLKKKQQVEQSNKA